MSEQIDKALDIIFTTTTAVCFIAAVFFITTATVDTYNGYNEVTGLILDAGLSIMIGIAVSIFFIYVKSMGEE